MPDITKISGTVKLNFLVRKEVIISIHKILYSTDQEDKYALMFFVWLLA